ncbi:MAG: biliverdin-producing heme oxygenase [Deltaproteobacteria bacterium]|nr:biliverdin-producing heme oxygenase [Deltaproteobacteria bacterium]
MLVRVALETSNHHAAADEDRLTALDIETVDDYRSFLTRIYGFEVEVEAALAKVVDLDAAFVRDRAKTARLHHDLVVLGLTSEDIIPMPKVSTLTIRNAAQALGWMFVLERHTLLAGLIRRHVVRTLGYEILPGTSYLAAYGDTPGARFRAFGAALCAYAHTYPPASIVLAANEAFRAQRQWYATHAAFARSRSSARCATGR